MSQKWFRLYSEFATDPKIISLSEIDQLRFVKILCLKNLMGDAPITQNLVQKFCSIAARSAAQTLQRLRDKKLINEENQPINWAKRQFKNVVNTGDKIFKAKNSTNNSVPLSPTSLARKSEKTPPSEYRIQNTEINNKIDHTLTLTHLEPPVQPPRVPPFSPPLFAEFWEIYPYKKSLGAAQMEFIRLLAENIDAQKIVDGAARYREACAGKPARYLKYPANWLREKCFFDEEPETNSNLFA